MIISRSQALAAIARGDAAEFSVTDHDGAPMVVVDRYDHQRVDHYRATDADLERLGAVLGTNPMP